LDNQVFDVIDARCNHEVHYTLMLKYTPEIFLNMYNSNSDVGSPKLVRNIKKNVELHNHGARIL